MAFPPGYRSRVARTAERLRRLLSTGSCLRCYLSRIGGRISIWPCGRIHSGHLACGPSHWSHPASLTETSNQVTVRSVLELLGLVYRCSAPMDSSSSGKRSLCDLVVRSNLGFWEPHSRLFACRRGWDLCSSRAIGLHLPCAPGLRLDGDTRVRHLPVSFLSDYSLGSLIRVHCVECLLYERHAILCPNCSDRWHLQCAASLGSRAVGSLPVENARLATVMGK
jgi:hypothetical protein